MITPVDNPPNPFDPHTIEWLDEPPEAKIELFEETAKSIITENKSPDVGFNFSVNPYRGCFHACAYCYARPSHQYLGFGAGTDFERRIVVKRNAPELLRREMMRPSWRGEPIVFSGNTDCYQPIEASYKLTRRCLEVCLDFRNPVSIITKGALVQRDLELLAQLSAQTEVMVYFSIAFSDDGDSRLIEPHAPRPSIRFRAMKELAEAGIPVSLALAPVIPGLNDFQIPEILTRAKECGARFAFMNLVRLSAEVQPVFISRLTRNFPNRTNKVLNAIKEMKGGALNRTEFGARMRGAGERWDAVEWLFKETCRKLDIATHGEHEAPEQSAKRSSFRRPAAGGRQLTLFD